MKYFKLTSAAVFACATLSVNASEQQVVVDETILVTASRSEQSTVDVLSSFSILTRSDIELSPAQSVAELLNEVNGIQISQQGGAGQTASVYSRGTNTGHILVVVDGQRINSATLGQVEFSNLAIDQIERIEIIKGPRASIWGSDAIGGVIQIFTRQLNGGEVALDLSLGNFSQQQLSASGAVSHGDGATTLTVSHRKSDGYDVFDLAESDADGYRRDNLAISGHQQLDQDWRVNWLVKYNEGDSEFDNLFGGANESSLTTSQWHISAKQLTQDWSQQFSVGQQRNEMISFGNGIKESDGSLFETQRLQANWLGHTQLSPELAATLGADFIREQVTTQTQYSLTKRDISAVYGHLIFDNDAVITEASLRYDDIENVGSEVTYNASAGLHLSSDSILSINLGHGFKAPGFNDLYYPKNAFSYGNPELEAETSDSIELLYKNQIGGIYTELSLYQTDIDNLIEWTPDQNFAYRPLNVATAKIKGAELTLQGQMLGLNHSLQLGYLDPKNANDDSQLIRRAKRTANYQLAYDWDNISLQASVHYQGKRRDIEWPSTIELPSHTLVHLSGHYRLDNQWTLGIKANNIFDREYVTANHYVGQPAQYLVTLSYRQ